MCGFWPWGLVLHSSMHTVQFHERMFLLLLLQQLSSTLVLKTFCHTLVCFLVTVHNSTYLMIPSLIGKGLGTPGKSSKFKSSPSHACMHQLTTGDKRMPISTACNIILFWVVKALPQAGFIGEVTVKVVHHWFDWTGGDDYCGGYHQRFCKVVLVSFILGFWLLQQQYIQYIIYSWMIATIAIISKHIQRFSKILHLQKTRSNLYQTFL